MHDMEVGRSIRRYRKAAKMSMQVLADRLGVSYQQVQKYELGVNRISAGRLIEVAEILCVPVAQFFNARSCAAVEGSRSDPTRAMRCGDNAEEDPHIAEAFLVVKEFLKIDDPARRLDALSYVRALADGKVP